MKHGLGSQPKSRPKTATVVLMCLISTQGATELRKWMTEGETSSGQPQMCLLGVVCLEDLSDPHFSISAK